MKQTSRVKEHLIARSGAPEKNGIGIASRIIFRQKHDMRYNLGVTS